MHSRLVPSGVDQFNLNEFICSILKQYSIKYFFFHVL